jgi:Protein of unknown function (DUF3617)
MNTRWHWSGVLPAAASMAFLTLTPARADDPPGILWDTTSQMVMEGMPFSPPPQHLKLCAAKTWTRPPPGGDQTCVNSDFKVVGNKATWNMQCSGDMPMTGSGEMTFEGTDAYTGEINATADGMNMTIKLTGNKIGTCDKPMD